MEISGIYRFHFDQVNDVLITPILCITDSFDFLNRFLGSRPTVQVRDARYRVTFVKKMGTHPVEVSCRCLEPYRF